MTIREIAQLFAHVIGGALFISLTVLVFFCLYGLILYALQEWIAK